MVKLELTKREAKALRALLVMGVDWDESTPEILRVWGKLVDRGGSDTWDEHFTVVKGNMVAVKAV